MQPTRLQIRNRALSILDDPSGSTYSDNDFQQGFAEAYDALFGAFLTNQVSRLTNIISYNVPVNTLSLTPANIGIIDFGGHTWLRERRYGSGDRFVRINEVDVLPQRIQVDRLLDFTFRNDTFYFVGATGIVELQMEYEISGEAPTNDSDVVLIDGTLTFLANYAAGVMGGRKGDDAQANRAFALAVGPKYNMGTIGGELFRIVQDRVRSRQHVQLAGRPYTAVRRRRLWPVPFIAAPGPTGEIFSRTLLVYDTTVGNDIAPHVTVPHGGATIQVTAVLRKAIASDLTVRINVVHALTSTSLITVTIPHTLPVNETMVFSGFDGAPRTLANLDVLTFDILASDSSTDSDGVASCTLEWAG